MDPDVRWTRASLMDEAQKLLEAVNLTDITRNVEWIFCELLKCNRAALYAYPEVEVPADLVEKILKMVQRRANHEPLQYILGYTEFCGLRFEVTPDVLIPRPETELLIELVSKRLSSARAPRVLDVGAGSGCIPVSIKYFNPEADVYSCDISQAALNIAATNAQTNKVPVTFFPCDILTQTLPFPEDQRFDVIVSNPPYIPHAEYLELDIEVLKYEPGLALDAGKDPLIFYRAIGQMSLKRLTTTGTLFFETHCDYAKDVAALLISMNFVTAKVHKDLTGRNRFVEARV